ncbi:cilia- and flagella-associated protein 43-like [Penaeus vannamei]|uniref:cilia- and flagella-associated protein 43-like n=1 Tax=Penaeus vannamei TaxID=6689 RepID=UPI00387F544C
MVEGESPKSASYETLEYDLKQLSRKLEDLLEENQALDDTHRLPVTEFTVTPRRVAALQDQLLQQESGVVREVERERLLRLLQCHHLKNAAWDNLEVKSRSLFCISSDVSVKNYPVEVPRAEAWRKVVAAVKARLQELRGGQSEEKKRVKSFKSSSSQDDYGDEDEHLLLELTEGEYKELLYPQLDLTCREKVEKQLVLITFMTRRLKDAFNARFDGAHQKKGRVIEEVHRLTRRERQLKPLEVQSLMQEFDSQVKALVDSRVATDEALLIYALVASRLQMRLFRQEGLEARLASLQEQCSQAETREEQLAEEEETTRREEARAKAKQERLQDQLKEEETALRRTIINLPIDQYNHLLALYNKRTFPSSRYLDLPSARGHHGGGDTPSVAPPLSPTGGGPLSPSGGVSPAQSESGASGRRGSTRPSRPASGASHTDELRSGEDQMPEGLAGGARTWRQFLRYRRRRQDLLEEADDATTKRATATAHLHTLDAQRTALRQELAQLEATVAEVSQELRLVDEDMELVLLLQNGQVKMDLDALTKSLQPDFQGTRLLQGSELTRLNAMAEKCGEIREEGDEEEEDTAEKDEELETLRTLKGQLELQVELVQQELHQINTFKVGRDVISAAADVVEGGEQQDSTQLYGSLQRLQQLHGGQAESLAKSSTSLEKQVRRSRRRVSELQRQAEDLAREIDDLQLQVTQAQPEVHMASRENRLRRVMICSDLTSQTRRRQATILDLEHELDTLRLRTFPMLSRPPPPTL